MAEAQLGWEPPRVFDIGLCIRMGNREMVVGVDCLPVFVVPDIA